MKNLIMSIITLFMAATTFSLTPPDGYMRQYNESRERTEWMTEARFGMFIHFGAYAVPARSDECNYMVKAFMAVDNPDLKRPPGAG